MNVVFSAAAMDLIFVKTDKKNTKIKSISSYRVHIFYQNFPYFATKNRVPEVGTLFVRFYKFIKFFYKLNCNY